MVVMAIVTCKCDLQLFLFPSYHTDHFIPASWAAAQTFNPLPIILLDLIPSFSVCRDSMTEGGQWDPHG